MGSESDQTRCSAYWSRDFPKDGETGEACSVRWKGFAKRTDRGCSCGRFLQNGDCKAVFKLYFGRKKD